MTENGLQTANGSCLCGSVSFTITGRFEGFFLCHCSRCRKDTGSTHAANLFSTRATIQWRSGEELIRTYKLPATRHQRSFCGQCGSALPNVQMGGDLLAIPAGSLDSPVTRRPDAHICFDSRADWDRQGDDIPLIGGLPE